MDADAQGELARLREDVEELRALLQGPPPHTERETGSLVVSPEPDGDVEVPRRHLLRKAGATVAGAVVGGVAYNVVAAGPAAATTSQNFLASTKGTASGPAFGFTAAVDNNSGVYSIADDQLGITTGGVQRLLINNTGLDVVSGALKQGGVGVALTTDSRFTNLQSVDGSASAPGHAFTGEPSTGLFRAGPGQLGVAVGGTERVRVDSGGVDVVSGALKQGGFGVTQVINVKDPQYADPVDGPAIGDGVHDDTKAIQNALNALPAWGGEVYFPPGNYRVVDTLTVHQKAGWVIRGAGTMGSRILFNFATVKHGFDIEGSLRGSIDGLWLTANGPLDCVVALDWFGVAGTRPTSGNCFRDVYIDYSAGYFKHGFAVGTRSTGPAGDQCDLTSFVNCTVAGGATWDAATTWEDPDKFQTGFFMGNGTHGNIVMNRLYHASAAGLKYGVRTEVTDFQLFGGSFGNEVDFRTNGDADPILVEGLRSENARRLFEDTPWSTQSPRTITFSSINFVGNRLASDARWIVLYNPASLVLHNVEVGAVASGVSPKVYMPALGNEPTAVTAVNVKQPSTLANGFELGSSVVLRALNYQELWDSGTSQGLVKTISDKLA